LILVRPSVCVLYQTQRLDEKEYLAMRSFQSNLVVYILLIPTNTIETGKISYQGKTNIKKLFEIKYFYEIFRINEIL